MPKPLREVIVFPNGLSPSLEIPKKKRKTRRRKNWNRARLFVVRP